MRNFLRLLLFTMIFVLCSSCLKQSETITPLAEPRTLAELQREAMMSSALQAAGNYQLSEASKATFDTNTDDPDLFYLNLKYKIVNIDLFETADIPNGFEQIGSAMLKIFAKFFLKLSESRTINIGDVELPLPDLNLDFNIIKSIKMKSVYIEYNKEYDASTGNKANFSFINTLKLSSVENSKPIVISYNKDKNTCNYKCLNFNINNGDIFDLVKTKKTVMIKPSLTINSFPDVSELKLDGHINLQIGLKLPF